MLESKIQLAMSARVLVLSLAVACGSVSAYQTAIGGGGRSSFAPTTVRLATRSYSVFCMDESLAMTSHTPIRRFPLPRLP